MPRPLLLGAVCVLLVIGPMDASDERIDTEVNWRIRQEGTTNSQIMHTMHYLTDVYGPRLTGSPNHEAAARWVVQQLEAWGLQNGHLEPWDFGHPGWLNERLTAHIVSPVKDHLVGEVLAWTPSTEGMVTAEAYQLVPPTRPTDEQLTAFFERVIDIDIDEVRGQIVLVGEHRTVPVTLTGEPRRRTEAALRAEYDPSNIDPAQAGPPRRRPPAADDDDGVLSTRQVAQRVAKFLRDNGALVQVNDAGRDHGQIRAFSNRTYDPEQAAPTVVMRNEDFGRIARLLANGSDPRHARVQHRQSVVSGGPYVL